jgi:DNA-binding NtrC family response regulator
MPLALHMVERYNKELKKSFTGFTPAAAEIITNYSWPGNIRELKNVIERTMILAPGNEIDEAYLPEEIREYSPPEPQSETPWYTDSLPTGQQVVTLRDLEDRYIHEVLVATGHNKAQAARILGIHPTSLMRRLKKEQEVETATSSSA